MNFFFFIFFRAELGDDEYIPLIECDLENVVIIKKNPDW
jgi:hypothetical protein